MPTKKLQYLQKVTEKFYGEVLCGLGLCFMFSTVSESVFISAEYTKMCLDFYFGIVLKEFPHSLGP